MSGIGEVFEKHPYAIGAALVGVALLAYFTSQQSEPDTREYTFAAGGTPKHGIDPEASAISQAAIAAGERNVGTLAQLVLGMDTNAASSRVELADTEARRAVGLSDIESGRAQGLAQTEASRTVGLAGINANLRASLFDSQSRRDVSLAQIGADRDVGMAGISANRDIAFHRDDTELGIWGVRTQADIENTRITTDYQRDALAAQDRADKRAADNENFRIQADKDKARAAANTSIVNNIVDVGKSVLRFFGW